MADLKNAANFQYEPLDTGEIRLLKLLSLGPDKLTFKTAHVLLRDRPRYFALSYTWDHEEERHDIILDEDKFRIQPNLFDALQQFEALGILTEYLWVDAICIDQSSNEERSRQVRMMREIYEGASKVLVWLGTPDNEIENNLAFRKMQESNIDFYTALMKSLLSFWPKSLQSLADNTAGYVFRQFHTVTAVGVAEMEADQAMRGFASLLKKRWWQRAWVYQEATVPEHTLNLYMANILPWGASEKVTVFCGDKQISFTKFMIGFLVLGPRISVANLGEEARDAKVRCGNLLVFRGKRLLKTAPTFLQLLETFRPAQATDARDKVFAPLCLASDDVRNFIEPSYDESRTEIYGKVINYLLQDANKLDFLGHAGSGQGLDEILATEDEEPLPSWLPNWAVDLEADPIPKCLNSLPPNRTEKTQSFIWPFGNLFLRTDPQGTIPTYEAMRSLGAQPRIDGKSLLLTAVYVDVLSETMRINRSTTDPDRIQIIKEANKWAAKIGMKYFTGENVEDALNHTLLLDLSWKIRHDSNPDRGGKYDSSLSERLESELTHEEYRRKSRMTSSLRNAAMGRQLGLSQKHYLLMVPRSAKVGDLIWAFAGGQTLYVLRPTQLQENEYMFVGECYAHGLMDGEIEKQLNDGIRILENISLV